MPSYLAAVNERIGSVSERIPRMCLFGQNLNTGTFISGLSKNLHVPPSGRIINTPNCEDTLCGMGLGMMLNGASAIYLVKQQDFMLLGIDQFVNTLNFIRCSRSPETLGSFTIIPLVCDQGMQGPQSSLNNFADYSSIARIPCYSLTTRCDIDAILESRISAPGFRMIGVSSRMAKTELRQPTCLFKSDDCALFQYAEGRDVTIVCFNFSVTEGFALHGHFDKAGFSASLFSANYVPDANWAPIFRSVGETRRLVVMDDSKSVNIPAYKLIASLHQTGLNFKSLVVAHNTEVEFGLSPDRYLVNYEAIISCLDH
jgi:pyruvate dehydrogenase E1 component beta subunit